MKSSNRNSVIFMILFTAFLAFMDIKDLYYKIIMTGPMEIGNWAFAGDTTETVSDVDLTQVLRKNNGTRIYSHNMWNALATRCDSLNIGKLDGKYAHVGALGTGCIIDGVKQDREIVFMGSLRADDVVAIASIIGTAIRHPLKQKTWYTEVWAYNFDLPETTFVDEAKAMIQPEHIPQLKTTLDVIYKNFADDPVVWEAAMCYEMMEMPEIGEVKADISPVEFGCIWTDENDENLRTAYVPPTLGKYFHHYVERIGLLWHTVDLLHIGRIHLRNTVGFVAQYTLDRTAKANGGEDKIKVVLKIDISMDGVLYYAIILIEIMIAYINIGDTCTVAFLVIRPLVLSSQKSSVSAYSQKATHVSTQKTSENANEMNKGSTQTGSATTKQSKDELSLALLYTDLSSVTFHNRLLDTLLVIDTFGSWLYIIPSSTIIAWSTNFFQLSSAVLSNFRIWPVVLIVINNLWRWTAVLLNERLAAVITEFTYITSFEVMCATLLAVYLEYDNILIANLIKWGIADRQRVMVETANGIVSFYPCFTRYSYGDRSMDSAGMNVLYSPLMSILSHAVGFSILIGVIKGMYYAGKAHFKGTLVKDVMMLWRTYRRNSIEVYMNDPIRAKAIVRSQKQMGYRLGNSVYIRPFVYLEQNYNIDNGKFCRRPLIPFTTTDMDKSSVEVDANAYTIHGVVKDNQSDKIKRKRQDKDNQIPLS